MNFATRVRWTLFGSLILMVRAIPLALSGKMDLWDFEKYYLLALFVSWAGLLILHRFIVWFAYDTAKHQIERSHATPRRRRSDNSDVTAAQRAAQAAGAQVTGAEAEQAAMAQTAPPTGTPPETPLLAP